MLKFQPFSIDKKSLLDKYFSAYGEGSCQHSFVSSFCMFEKYGDHFAIKDDFLFVRREKRCTNQSLVYLFPFGDMGDSEKVRHAVDSVIEDARSHGCKVRFETVTEKAKNFIMENYPGIFSVTELRDVAEYIYDCEKFASMDGGEYHDRRRHVRKFLETYKGHWNLEPVNSNNFNEMMKLANEWLQLKIDDENKTQLTCEHSAIEKSLKNWDALGMKGIVLRIDGEVCGFIYGMRLNDDTFNAMILKADKSKVYISPFLYRSFAELCSKTSKWLNLEEDLGDKGLRQMKLSYRPDHFLNKYLVEEVDE